jgi:iron only hydrogenase large subunit-like protein
LNALDTHKETPLPVEKDGKLCREDEISHEGKIFVASVSPQVRASLAATFNVSEKDAGYMIDQFLRGPYGLRAGGKHKSGFSWVIDTNIMREVVLAHTAEEVSRSLQQTTEDIATLSLPIPRRPILSSACPGWICYAEKTHPHILPHLSRLKSPQAMTGTLLKTVLSKALCIPPSQVWHLAIMPCFDKKLEASREELTDASWQNGDSQLPTRDVDCVITSRELLMLASKRGISFPSLPSKPLISAISPRFPEEIIHSFISSPVPNRQLTASGTSGGYLYYILRHFQRLHRDSSILAQRGRNADVVEYTLVSRSGEPIIKAARYYGFRNIQNLVRKLKPVRTSRLAGIKTQIGPPDAQRRSGAIANATSSIGFDYAYVEVMACPGGCTNGGGQIRVEDVREANASLQSTFEVEQAISNLTPKSSLYEQRDWLACVDEAYFSAESESETEFESHESNYTDLGVNVKGTTLTAYWSRYTGIPVEKLIHTTYRRVESDVGRIKSVNDTVRVAELAGKIGAGW